MITIIETNTQNLNLEQWSQVRASLTDLLESDVDTYRQVAEGFLKKLTKGK